MTDYDDLFRPGLSAVFEGIPQDCHVTRAIFLVQEFWTELTTDAKHAANARDLNAFATRLSHGHVLVLEPGVLYGPFTVPQSPLFAAAPALFLGKVRRSLRGGRPKVNRRR